MHKQAYEMLADLRPHQQRAVDKIKAGGALVAHGTGSGKTMTAIAGGAGSDYPVVALVPPGLKGNFEKELGKWTNAKPGEVDVRSITTSALHNQTIPKGSYLIVDEAHGLRNENTDRRRHVAALAGLAGHVALLTGTPQYNAPSDVAPLVNIAAGKQVLPEDPREFDARFIQTEPDSPGILGRLMGMDPGEVPRLKNVEELEEAMRGRVDTFKSGGEGYPEVNESTIKVPMGSGQRNVYEYLEGQLPWWARWKVRWGLPPSKSEAKQLNAFLGGVRQASNSSLPYTTSSSGPTTENSAKLVTAADNLSDFMKKVKNSRALVYSNYMQAGLLPYARLLKEKGIPYALITGDQSLEERLETQRKYNAGQIPVLLGSSAAAEGLDLKGTRLVQVLEPHFNESKLQQVIGRAARYNSHAELPPEDRNVRVERYESQLPRPGWFMRLFSSQRESVDEWMRQRAQEKQRIMSQLYQVMERASAYKGAPR